MLTKLIQFFKNRRAIVIKEPFDPTDFSRAATLHITVKKDGTKVYRPYGVASKKGTPVTTIEYEDESMK